MNRSIAILLSVVFHPIFVNLLCLLSLLYWHPFVDASLSSDGKLFYTLYVFITTAMIPLLLVVARKFMGYSKSVMLENADERHVPYISSACANLFGCYLFLKIGTPKPLQALLLAQATISVLLLIINFRTKISAHATCLGCLIGVFLAISPIAFIDMRVPIVMAFIVAGITASARVFLQAHSLAQIYSGFALGLFVMAALI